VVRDHNGTVDVASAEVTDRPGRIAAGAGHQQDQLHVAVPLTVADVPGDVFFRIGGPHVGKAALSLEVNSDNVLLDHIWAWRADHGKGVGWTTNTGKNGVIINGDNVTATGLFVEHYQEYNVIWNGEHGKTVFFQNELPYDAPNQAAWQHDGVLGWAGYKIADSVRNHELWGGGSYVYNNVDPTIHATRGFEVPVTPGVKLHGLLTVNLGAGTHPGPRRQRHRRAGLNGRRRGAQLRRKLRLRRRRRAGSHVPPAGQARPRRAFRPAPR
jgi:hypothetical protein